jgi:hypothetical protein
MRMKVKGGSIDNENECQAHSWAGAVPGALRVERCDLLASAEPVGRVGAVAPDRVERWMPGKRKGLAPGASPSCKPDRAAG